MGEPVPISLGLRSNPARERQAGYARLLNCFAEEQGEDAKVNWIIYGIAGLAAFGNPLDGGGIRSMIAVGSTLYAIAGRNVYTVTAQGVSTRIGGIPTTGPVYMEINRADPTQIGIVSDGLFYYIDTSTNTLTQIQDADLPAPISLSFLDGYGILPVANSRFYLTGIDDFTTIDGLDEGVCEAYPDEIVRSAVLEREAVFFGERSIEWHQNTGDADFPLTRAHATEIGCLSGGSVAKVDTKTRKTLIWVAPDHTVRMMTGYSGQVISTNEIQALIKELHTSGGISQLKGIAWADAGRFYYALSCDAWTRVFDSGTNYWHERRSAGLTRWRVAEVCSFANKMIAGDWQTGQLYIMGDEYFDEAGETLAVEITTPPVHAFPYRLIFNGLYIDAATGVGLNTADPHGLDPKLMVSWSDDGGASFSAERERSLSRLSESFKRIQPIYRMGKSGQKGRVYKFRISAPVKKVMMQVSIDFDRIGA